MKRLALVALAACGSPERPIAPPPANTPVAAPAPAPAPDASPQCGADIATRSAGAIAEDPLDLDGDGDLDLVFRSDGDDLHGNAEFFLYRVDGACAAYLGSVTAFAFNRPYCAAPPARGAVCRIVARRRMYHDDYQDEHYAYTGTTFERDD